MKNKSIEHYQNRINILKYKDEVSNSKKQVSNKNLIRKAMRKLRSAEG